MTEETAERKLPKVRGRLLTAQAAVKLFSKFWEACGPGECRAAFGWDRPRGVLHPNESVYEFRGEGSVVGFGSLQINLRDADDNDAAFVCGVLPEFRRRGYWHAIAASLARRAERAGADYMSRVVFRSNAEHYERSIRESKHGPWVYAGDVWFPDAYGYFVLPLGDRKP